MTMSSPIHLVIDGMTVCGIAATTTVATVPPRWGKHVTCKRCLAILNKFGAS